MYWDSFNLFFFSRQRYSKNLTQVRLIFTNFEKILQMMFFKKTPKYSSFIMEQFVIKLLFQIIGIGSASGLVYKDNSLFLISDNSTFLYQYLIDKKELCKIELTEKAQDNIPKKNKFDFESIVLKGDKLHVLGSGSTSKREKRITYNLETKEITQKDLSKLYRNLKNSYSIADDELNIEGALYCNENWLLFQRGNGANSKNGIFRTKSLQNKSDTEFIEVALPKIKQVETSFTDAILVEDSIYFLATAENTTSTYDDGEIFGSVLGKMNAQTFEIAFTQKISDTQKFEGLTLYKNTETEIQFLICEDNDSDLLQSNIYKVSFTKD